MRAIFLPQRVLSHEIPRATVSLVSLFSHCCFCVCREEPTPRIQQHSGIERKQQHHHRRMRYRIYEMGRCFSGCGESDVGERCRIENLSDYQRGVNKFQTRNNMQREGRSGVQNIISMKWTNVSVVTLEGTHLTWQFSSETSCQSRAQESQLWVGLGRLGPKRDCKVICCGWTKLLFCCRSFS